MKKFLSFLVILGLLFVALSPLTVYAITPTDISNLKVWYDSTDSTTMFTDASCTAQVSASGQEVKCWKDKSSNLDHAVEVSGEGAPQYLTGQFAGHSVLDFNKSEDDTLMHTLSSPWTSDFTLFIVMNSTDSSPADNESLFSNGDEAIRGHFQIDYGLTEDNFRYKPGSPGDTIAFGSFDNDIKLYTVANDGTTITTYSNGAQVEAVDTVSGRTFEQYRINRNRNGGANHDSQIAEIILYNKVLSSYELGQMNAYLGGKYGEDFSSGEVSHSTSMTIGIGIIGGPLDSVGIIAIPEKRVSKPGGNLANYSRVRFVQAGEEKQSSLFTTLGVSGLYSGLDISSLTEGDYDIYVKGSVHLTRKISQYMDLSVTTLDFTDSGNNPLLAGDVNGSILTDGDDVINSLDLSLLLNDLDVLDNRTDLNKDNIVNALDLAMIITNLDETGDA
jgi:hypothetical protein